MARAVDMCSLCSSVLLDGYIRVSQVGGRSGASFISPSVQREQIETWAFRHEVLIAHVFEELDESGARTDRPLLEQAIRRVERGESGGLVVAYLSRFGRSLVDGLAAIERITDAGGTFVSVQEGLDLSTDAGKLILRVLFSIAEWERDRTRTTWRIARERAVARGIGAPRRSFGYRRGPDRRLVVHATEGSITRELFERRAGGATLPELCDFLQDAGFKTPTGGPVWAPETVRGMIASRLYRGEIRHSGFSNPNAHEPLVDETTWRSAQVTALKHTVYRNVEVGLLRGILRCAGCQRPLCAGINRRGTSWEHRLYWCNPATLTGPCPAPVAIRDSRVEPYIEQLFWQELARPRRSTTSARRKRLQIEVDRRERELVAYRDNPSLPVRIGPDRFARGLTIRQQRVERAERELSRAAVARQPVLPSASDLRKRWSAMSIRERRQAIAQIIECVFVGPGHRSTEERLFVCRPGNAPEGLPPVIPRRPFETQPFDPAKCRPSLRLQSPEPLWDRDIVREELERFLASRDVWPGLPQFQSAGLGLLHAQICRQGGARAWAEATGRRWEGFRPLTNRATMSRERVRRELEDYLEGRDTWPTVKEFARDRKSHLRRVLLWFDTPENWASELGVRIGDRQHSRRSRSYEILRDEMADFAAGRTDWPPWNEFKASGRKGLYDTILAKQLREELAAELGLSLPRRKRTAARGSRSASRPGA